MKRVVCLFILILLLTACEDKHDEKLLGLNSLYNLTNDGIIIHDDNYTISKISTNDMHFYVYEYGIEESYYYTSILSSVYSKHREEIKELAKKNNIKISFNYTIEDYIDKQYFNNCQSCNHFLTIYEHNSENLKTLVNEILEIEEIKNLYNIWLNNSSSTYLVYDYSYIDDGDESNVQTIFTYYKNSSQND